jgi:hypothetical protein|nr:MAG TPA: Major capsid protein [Caudoviricetes sp.]
MTQQIDLVTKMLPLIDEVYKKEAKSAILEAPSELVQQTADANVFKIAKLALMGLGDYSKTTGFPEGDVSLTWETHQFTNDRGRRFSLDRMDNVESFGLVAARMVGEFLRQYVVPEIDAYRFAKIASKADNIATAATLTSSTAKSALDTAITTLQEKEVDDSRLIIFTTPTVAQLMSDNITRTTLNGENAINNVIESYNGIQIVRVPQTRFYTQITLADGQPASGANTAGGYSKTETIGADINFIVMDKSASVNITKSVVAKMFTPDENQNKDAWQFDYRLYHDSFVFDNKKAGIYLNAKAAG